MVTLSSGQRAALKALANGGCAVRLRHGLDRREYVAFMSSTGERLPAVAVNSLRGRGLVDVGEWRWCDRQWVADLVVVGIRKDTPW
jgi:hypothetical protein